MKIKIRGYVYIYIRYDVLNYFDCDCNLFSIMKRLLYTLLSKIRVDLYPLLNLPAFDEQ